MCGIAGELRFDGGPADVAGVERMAEQLAPRGPDGAGIWAQGPVALGHRRLAIIDLSSAGAQPMVDAELGLTTVFNGCIYNHQQLRTELEGHGYRFFSTSDTEVIGKAYHRWGAAFVDHLVGMFAVGIVERSGRAVLARDRLGIKPLYLAPEPDRLRFASTVPALLVHRDLDTSIDPVALQHYLTFHAVVPAPRTLLNGVKKLPPATVLVVEPDGRSTETRYWDPAQAAARFAGVAHEEWKDVVAGALRLAVERRLVADVPVGVLLSGGLDSSLIVGLLAEQGQTGLATFSIGFDSVGAEEGDEFEFSDLVAERFATDHHRLPIPTPDILSVIPETIATMSEPMVSHDVVAFYLLSREVAKHVKVVQCGQGADEVFAGYHWYQTLDDATGDPVDEYAGVFFDRDKAGVDQLAGRKHRIDRDLSREFVAEHFGEPGADTTVRKALRIDTHVMLVEDPVKRVDNTTMAWGLEARVPFLDHELVEVAAACPTDLLLANDGKGIIKDLAYEVLPREVIDRPKGYFPVPALTYLDDSVVELLRDALTSPTARRRDLFDRSQVDRLLERPDQLTRLKYNELWEIGVLELWLQAHDIS